MSRSSWQYLSFCPSYRNPIWIHVPSVTHDLHSDPWLDYGNCILRRVKFIVAIFWNLLGFQPFVLHKFPLATCSLNPSVYVFHLTQRDHVSHLYRLSYSCNSEFRIQKTRRQNVRAKWQQALPEFDSLSVSTSIKSWFEECCLLECGTCKKGRFRGIHRLYHQRRNN
jgi:hypothetical protein